MQLGNLVGVLQDMGLPRAQLALLKTLLQHAGCDKRVGDLYSNRSFTSRFATMAKHNLRVSFHADQTLPVLALLLSRHTFIKHSNLAHAEAKFMTHHLQ